MLYLYYLGPDTYTIWDLLYWLCTARAVFLWLAPKVRGLPNEWLLRGFAGGELEELRSYIMQGTATPTSWMYRGCCKRHMQDLANSFSVFRKV